MIMSVSHSLTETEKSCEEESNQEQGTREDELRIFANGRSEGLARGSLPDIVEWCGRHRGVDREQFSHWIDWSSLR